MGDDSFVLREDGYIRMNFPVTSLTYHTNLNKVLVRNNWGCVYVLDVNSGVVLQSTNLSSEGGSQGIEYVPGTDRVFVWDKAGIGARTDYNGVLLLQTALQRPLSSSQAEKYIKVELVLSEAVLLYQCLQSLDAMTIDGLSDFINELKQSIIIEPVRKGVKAQKWSTITIELPQATLRLVMTGVVQELKSQNQRIPALAIASAVGHRANELVPCSRDEESRALMYSEAERKETFKRWPHMDYKWARPARMAQAGFYHQPAPSGDDRAMCFTCMVCLVCWEKSDEPWVEHERHSPNCPFVRGEYTHNVPISVTNATACAVTCPNVTVISKGNTGEVIATGTDEGKVNIWRFDCGLKLTKFIHLSPYDSIFSGILPTDSNKVWSSSLEKDTSTYSLELTAMTFVGMNSQQENYSVVQNQESTETESPSDKAKPSLICAVTITRTSSQPDIPIRQDASKALFDSISDKNKGSVREMNVENEAKNQGNKILFLLTFDIDSSVAGSTTTAVHTSESSTSKPGGSKKVCSVARSDVSNHYGDIFFQYSDEDTELAQCTKGLLDDQISNQLMYPSSSSKDDKPWMAKQVLMSKHFNPGMADVPEAGFGGLIGIVNKKGWKNSPLDCAKLADQTDAALSSDSTTHFLNMNGPLEISALKWFEGGDNGDKVKVSTFGSKLTVPLPNHDGFDSDPPQEEALTQGVAVQGLRLPALPYAHADLCKVTHILPTEDKEHVLVILSSIEPNNVKNKVEAETDHDGDVDMADDAPSENLCSAYLLLYKINTKTSVYTLEDDPVTVKELPFNESPVDLCLLPKDKHGQYSVAIVGFDGVLRLYNLLQFELLTEKQVIGGHFTSIVYCSSVERLSVSTKEGMIYFYALNSNDLENATEMEEDLPQEQEAVLNQGTTDNQIIPYKTELDINDLETLISLTGMYGTNAAVPYTAVVPSFWCELSLAQRSRSDHLNNRSWRLQNTSSTWDEHVLELTSIPYRACLSHVEFNFTLHVPCTANLPIIQVTLLKQNLHGVGYKKDATFGQQPDSPIRFPLDTEVPTNIENPVNSEEYLQAHNAEILAGPLLLSSGLDITQQSGVLILTSPKLFRTHGHTLLIHIKTLYDPSKDVNKGSIKPDESGTKKWFIGCDWLHQISITVRSCPLTKMPVELARLQRIAMLESNSFLINLIDVVTSKADQEMRILALDLIIWIVTIRLKRLRVTKVEKDKDGTKLSQNTIDKQQLECVRIIEEHTDALIKSCILCSKRNIAKKCVKVLLITNEGVRQLSKSWKSTFEQTLASCVTNCVPLIAACDSPGAMKWLVALAQHVTDVSDSKDLVDKALKLLEKTANCIAERSNDYHCLLRSRFGLFGLPFERTIFDSEGPMIGKSTATPVTYASVLTGDSNPTVPMPKPDHQLKDLFTMSGEIESKGVASWWCVEGGVGVAGVGVSEATPLHVKCHVASDGTKLESQGGRMFPHVGPVPGDSQICTAVAGIQLVHNAIDMDSEDAEISSLMDLDQEKVMDFGDDKIYQNEECEIPWGDLVSRPPQHTLVVERMHSGARRYIVLDFGHTVKLTDIIIPSCSDLVTLCIDIWLKGEECDSVKLAFATDIATKHLVLTDIQPPPRARYMKITTIGRYGMSAMKCKIPLGWFYGEIDDITNVQASVNSLNALNQNLTCRYRLATGRLMDLLNPYLESHNGNLDHMAAYLASDADTKVLAAYQECIELQQQLHTCNNILNKLQNKPDCNEHMFEMINRGLINTDKLLERSSTDKLRVISENITDLLLHFVFLSDEMSYSQLTRAWCEPVLSLCWTSNTRTCAGLCTLLARLCATHDWWGQLLADALQEAFAATHLPPLPLDRLLVSVMYMGRKSSSLPAVCACLARACVGLVAKRSENKANPSAPLSATLVALASTLDAANRAMLPSQPSRWDWVAGGRIGSEEWRSRSPRSNESKLQRRKLQKKLIHHMYDLDRQRIRPSLKAHMAIYSKRNSNGSSSSKSDETAPVESKPFNVVPFDLAKELSQALVKYILSIDGSTGYDILLLGCKVVGGLCFGAGGGCVLEAEEVRSLCVYAISLRDHTARWPSHAVTHLLSDLVEFESGEVTTKVHPKDWSPKAGSTSRLIQVSQDDDSLNKLTCYPWSKTAGLRKTVYVPDTAGEGFGGTKVEKPKTSTASDTAGEGYGETKVETSTPSGSPGISGTSEYHLPLVAESDDSDMEENFNYLLSTLKDSKPKLIDTSSSVVCVCGDARLESSVSWQALGLAQRVLLGAGGALIRALRPTPPPPIPPPPTPTHHPSRPLPLTLYDAFRHLANNFHNQTDCKYLEGVLSLWMSLNGCGFGEENWVHTYTQPSPTPRIRLASDTVRAVLEHLCKLEFVSLKCWALSMHSLAWIASLPLQMEGSNQTMARVIYECEYFVPTIVKFVSMDMSTDGAVCMVEPFLGGAGSGMGRVAGSEASSCLSALCTRVWATGIDGSVSSNRALALALAQRKGPPDLFSTLIRVAQPLLTTLTQEHMPHAISIFNTVAQDSWVWLRSWAIEVRGRMVASTSASGNANAGAQGALSGLLEGGGRRSSPSRAMIRNLLNYCTKLLSLSVYTQQSRVGESQTDDRKVAEEVNLEDERKQRAHRHPTFADYVIQNTEIMHNFYKALSLCDVLNPLHIKSGPHYETMASNDMKSLKEEVFCLIVQLITHTSEPAMLVPTLIEYIKREEVLKISQGLQLYIVRMLDRAEALNAFVEAGGVELVCDKMNKCHQSGPSDHHGMVSSLMSHLKLPPQLINMSTSATSNKKAQAPVISNDNGLTNFAPFCTISCGNPTSSSAEALLGGGGVGGACSGRRVRSAAWSHHFFSAEELALPLALSLPHAILLHEIHLQPHLTSLATCPGAVGVAVGCGGLLSPLGAPQNTAGMTYIRLVLAKPIIATNVQIRLYRPRDSCNVGLLQLRLLGTPAFDKPQNEMITNRWCGIVSACTVSSLPLWAWQVLRSSMSSLVSSLSHPHSHSERALLALAESDANAAAELVPMLLDSANYVQEWWERVRECLRQVVLSPSSTALTTQALLNWLQGHAHNSLAHAPLITISEILWTLKEEKLVPDAFLEELVTDQLFEDICKWIDEVPQNSMLKKALDSIVCSICYIRPVLYRRLLTSLGVQIESVDESMCHLTDDSKAGECSEVSDSIPVCVLRQCWRLRTLALASLSPVNTNVLLSSNLLPAVVNALTKFSEDTLDNMNQQSSSSKSDFNMETDRTDSESAESISLSCACDLVQLLCIVSENWSVRGRVGNAKLWTPLLKVLCAHREPTQSWQAESQLARFEQLGVRLFTELTSAHAQNQEHFAKALHHVLQSDATGSEGMSGFTRSLILRLVLSTERVSVCVRGWRSPSPDRPLPHPSAPCNQLLQLPATTTVAQLYLQYCVMVSQKNDNWSCDVMCGINSAKKRENPTNSNDNTNPEDSDWSIRVQVLGSETCLHPELTLAQICAMGHNGPSPYLTLVVHMDPNNAPIVSPLPVSPEYTSSLLRRFGQVGGLALVASRLPTQRHRMCAPLATSNKPHDSESEWVKFDDNYEEIPSPPEASSSPMGNGCMVGVSFPLWALSLLLRLKGYADALLDRGASAIHLLRLLMGHPRDNDNRPISMMGSGWSLGTLPFTVLSGMLECTGDGSQRPLRLALLRVGAVKMLLACLALLTHHTPKITETPQEPQSGTTPTDKPEEKAALYWAKGTGFGTGSIQQSWNVEQALVRQRTEEHHITALLQVLASYMNPGEKWPPDENEDPKEQEQADSDMAIELPAEFVELVSNSCLLPAISSYLRNDSVLDMSRHIPLYVSVLRCARAVWRSLRPSAEHLPPLLAMMANTANSYANNLKISKKNVMGKVSFNQRYPTNSEEDEGLAALIADIQATASLLAPPQLLGEGLSPPRPIAGATREARYLEVMRRLQFETFEMTEEVPEGGYRFLVPYHFEGLVREAGERSTPSRMKRLAQEAATLANSLPLSYSSSVFVRTDSDRLDIMKVLITGPSDTPYANGCFVLDVYFPADYPAVPMLINLETTGRHSVRFNPNLYNDGKVCLSVLNTWQGRPEEKWNAHTSSFLQVLVSIQSLILVPEPYFNEPGYERSRGTHLGNNASLEYNSTIYQACVRWAMLDHFKNPSPVFKDVIETHFWLKRNEIMTTIAGWITELESRPGDERTQRTIQLNLMALKRHYVKIQEELAKIPCPPGLEELDEPFQLPPPAAPSQPQAAALDIDHDMEKIVSQVLD